MVTPVSTNFSKQLTNYFNQLTNCFNQLDKKIDENFQQNIIQQKIDELANQIKEKFSLFESFNKWLEENNASQWYTQLATYLVKLPVKAAKNVINTLYNIISQTLYMAVHPVKGVHCLAKQIVFLLNEISKPENWSKMGAGSLGMLTAQGMILGGPMSLIGLGIGAALIAGGMSVEIVSTLFEAKKGKENEALLSQIKKYAKQLPEALLTGVFTGLLIGGIRRAFAKPQQQSQPVEYVKPSAVDSGFDKIPDVAQYKWSDWSGHIKTVRDLTLDEAKTIASSDPKIDYFFFTKGMQMVLEPFDWDWSLENARVFHHGDAAFFSGDPWWGYAPGLADGYIKA